MPLVTVGSTLSTEPGTAAATVLRRVLVARGVADLGGAVGGGVGERRGVGAEAQLGRAPRWPCGPSPEVVVPFSTVTSTWDGGTVTDGRWLGGRRRARRERSRCPSAGRAGRRTAAESISNTLPDRPRRARLLVLQGRRRSARRRGRRASGRGSAPSRSGASLASSPRIRPASFSRSDSDVSWSSVSASRTAPISELTRARVEQHAGGGRVPEHLRRGTAAGGWMRAVSPPSARGAAGRRRAPGRR